MQPVGLDQSANCPHLGDVCFSSCWVSGCRVTVGGSRARTCPGRSQPSTAAFYWAMCSYCTGSSMETATGMLRENEGITFIFFLFFCLFFYRSSSALHRRSST